MLLVLVENYPVPGDHHIDDAARVAILMVYLAVIIVVTHYEICIPVWPLLRLI